MKKRLFKTAESKLPKGRFEDAMCDFFDSDELWCNGKSVHFSKISGSLARMAGYQAGKIYYPIGLAINGIINLLSLNKLEKERNYNIVNYGGVGVSKDGDFYLDYVLHSNLPLEEKSAWEELLLKAKNELVDLKEKYHVIVKIAKDGTPSACVYMQSNTHTRTTCTAYNYLTDTRGLGNKPFPFHIFMAVLLYAEMKHTELSATSNYADYYLARNTETLFNKLEEAIEEYYTKGKVR